MVAREHKAVLVVASASMSITESALRDALAVHGVRTRVVATRLDRGRDAAELTCDLRWRAHTSDREPSELLRSVLQLPDVTNVDWRRLS